MDQEKQQELKTLLEQIRYDMQDASRANENLATTVRNIILLVEGNPDKF